MFAASYAAPHTVIHLHNMFHASTIHTASTLEIDHAHEMQMSAY